ncbi:MAG: hypothetical protein ACOX2F_10460 [bacterium]
MKIKRVDSLSFKNFFVFVVVFVLYLAISEFSLHISGTKNILNDLEYYASKTFTEEQWEDAEKFRKDIVSIGQRGVLIKDSIVYNYKPAQSETINFNSHGFRGKEPEPKAENEIRIAIFGASRIWGNYLSDNKTVPALVEKELNQKFPDKKITVLNFGIEGYDLQRGTQAAKMFFKGLSFDIILFYFGFSDMNYAYLNGNMEWTPFDSNTPMSDESFEKMIHSMFPKGWVESRKLYNLVLHSIKGELTKSFSLTETKKYKEIPQAQLETSETFHKIFFKRMEETALFFNEKEVKTILIFPPVPQTKKNLSKLEREMTLHYETLLPGYNKFVKRCIELVLSDMKTKNKNFLFVNQTEIFDHDYETVFFDGMHLTPAASVKTALEISTILTDFLD